MMRGAMGKRFISLSQRSLISCLVFALFFVYWIRFAVLSLIPSWLEMGRRMDARVIPGLERPTSGLRGRAICR